MNNNYATIVKNIQFFGKDIELEKLTNPTLKAILTTITPSPSTYGKKEKLSDSTLDNWAEYHYSDWGDYGR